jgi:hypothetical protein
MAHLDKNNVSAKYRRNVYNLVKGIFEVAVDYDLIPASPIRPRVHRPKVNRRKLLFFTLEQVRAILTLGGHPKPANSGHLKTGQR